MVGDVVQFQYDYLDILGLFRNFNVGQFFWSIDGNSFVEYIGGVVLMINVGNVYNIGMIFSDFFYVLMQIINYWFIVYYVFFIQGYN